MLKNTALYCNTFIIAQALLGQKSQPILARFSALCITKWHLVSCTEMGSHMEPPLEKNMFPPQHDCWYHSLLAIVGFRAVCFFKPGREQEVSLAKWTLQVDHVHAITYTPLPLLPSVGKKPVKGLTCLREGTSTKT